MAKNNPKPKVEFKEIPRFELERYKGKSSRFTCPSCHNSHTFAKYLDITTGEYVGDDIGRCNREEKCGYHKPPTGTDLDGKPLLVSSNEVKKEYLPKEVTNLIDSKFVVKSLNGKLDNLSKFLYKYFDKKTVDLIRSRYKIGYDDLWEDSTVFWQIDKDWDVRTGKIMLYDEETCKRVKNPNHITWVHSPLNKFDNQPDFCLTQCFFGEHLLSDDISTYKVVESEKTAILCSILKPNEIYIATGGLQNINETRLLPFKDKELIFYPDKGEAVNLWKKKLKPFQELFNIKIDESINKIDYLEDGADLGDFIIRKYIKK